MTGDQTKTEALGELTRVTGASLAEPGVTLSPGTPVGRYVILDQVGRGGMGEVYSAFDPQLDRRIALKFLRGAGSEDAERLLEEARTLAQLSHPNVLPVFDVGTFGASTFIATEFVQGGTLREWLDQGRHEPNAAIELFITAGEGLKAAHQAGVIHRDFKPSNVLLGDDGRVRVADFGVAKRTGFEKHGRSSDGQEDSADSWTADGSVSGTPGYMSPEQIRGEDQDARTDQFSFACALYEALTGARPFESISLKRRLESIENADFSSLASVKGLSERSRSAIRRMLAFDRDSRFDDMEQALSTLSPTSAQRRWWMATAASLAVAIAAAGVAIWQGSKDEPVALCLGGGERIASVWNDNRRDLLNEVFADTPEPVWQSAQSHLDTYADEWNEAYTQSCEATHVLGEQSAQLLDHSMSCLDGRLAELSAAVDLFAEGETADRLNAVRVTGQLSPVSACTNRERLLAADPLPERPEERAVYNRLRDAVAQTKVLMDGRRYETVIEDGTRFADEAREAGFLATESVARNLVGDAMERLGQVEEAKGSYLRGIVAGIQGGSNERAARAAAGIAWPVSRLGESKRALEWLELAQALMHSVPHDPLLEAHVHTALSTVYQELADYEKSIQHAEQAYQIELQNRGLDHLKTASSYANLGNAKRFLGDFEGMIEHTRAAIEVFEPKLGFKHRDTLQLYTNLAGVLTELDRAKEALPIMLRTREAMVELYGPDNLETAFQNINLGAGFAGVGRHEEAVSAYQDSIDGFSKNLPEGHIYFAYAFNGAAASMLALERNSEALEMIQPAWSIVTSQETHPQLIAEIGMVLLQASAAVGDTPDDIQNVLRLTGENIEAGKPATDDLVESYAELRRHFGL